VWETTQETAWALIGLTDWLLLTGELDASYDYGVWLNDAERLTGTTGASATELEPVTLKIALTELLRDSSNQLTIGRSAGSGRLYYTAHLRAFLPAEDLSALDRGISVRRRYTLASCEDGPACPEVDHVQLGEEIRVELSIVAPHDLYYVVIEDGLPAGAEAFESSLPDIGFGGPIDLLAPEPAGGLDSAPYMWWWRWYTRSEFRDEKVVLFADYMPRGAYLYSYTLRATQPGEFRAIPTTASTFYFPEVYGRAAGRVLRVQR
jgi:hypothetical protein